MTKNRRRRRDPHHLGPGLHHRRNRGNGFSQTFAGSGENPTPPHPRDFGPQTRLIGIELRKDQAWVTASPPRHPEKGWEYGYSLRDGMKFWSDVGVSRPDNDAQMINADEVLKMVDALDGLKQKALAQVGEQDAEIERVNFYRYRPLASSKLLLIEFTMATNGRVTYDSTGRLVK